MGFYLKWSGDDVSDGGAFWYIKDKAFLEELDKTIDHSFSCKEPHFDDMPNLGIVCFLWWLQFFPASLQMTLGATSVAAIQMEGDPAFWGVALDYCCGWSNYQLNTVSSSSSGTLKTML